MWVGGEGGGGTDTATIHMFWRTRSRPVASSMAGPSSPALLSAGSMRARSGQLPAHRPITLDTKQVDPLSREELGPEQKDTVCTVVTQESFRLQ